MKKFLIIGNMTAVIYKDIFPLIKENKICWGCSTSGSARNMWFSCPNTYEATDKNANYKEIDNIKYRRVQGIEWYTNLDHAKRHTELDLYKKYNADEYPKYDNYDAIEVSKVAEIPMDYDGVMGVPITFIDKLNRNQFEIIGIMNSCDKVQPIILGKKKYARLLIKRKK